MTAPQITLYTGQSANGIKISITLEELGLPYEVRKIDMSKNEQKSEWFTRINPNGRIPAITDVSFDGGDDDSTGDDNGTIRVFESGSIMLYLVHRYDHDYKISFPAGTREYVEMTNWLFFQNAGVGPMQGQANHFVRYARDRHEYAAKRYQDEVRRLYGVLERHLGSRAPEQGSDGSGSRQREFLVGDKCTIADIALWGWVAVSRWAGVELAADFPQLMAWEERMLRRPAVERGRHVPDRHHRELLQDARAIEQFEQRGKAFYRQREAEADMTAASTAALAAAGEEELNGLEQCKVTD